jgi:hypothetical protein
MKRFGLSLVLAVAIAALGAGIWDMAFAEPLQANATTLTLNSDPRLNQKGAVLKGQYVIAATLSAGNKFISQQPVVFREHVDLFGPRDADLGTAVTDSTGTAVIFYQPAVTGPQLISAQFVGDDAFAGSSATITLDVREVVPVFTSDPSPLASVGKWLTVSLGVLGVAFWAVVLGTFTRAVVKISSASPDASRVAEPSLVVSATKSTQGGVAVQKPSRDSIVGVPPRP